MDLVARPVDLPGRLGPLTRLTMSGYLSIELDNLAVDPVLMTHLPAGLAAYYLALPLACEDGVVSVAMAHPENKTALAVLANLFAAPVVPVRAPATAIRQALSCCNPAKSPLPRRVLAWSSQDEQIQLAAGIAACFVPAEAETVTAMSASELDLESLLDVAREGRYSLTVIHLPQERVPALLLQEAATPLLVLRNGAQELHRILVALRGYSADGQLLDWLAPLLQPDTSVTFMPLHADNASGQPSFLLNRVERSHLKDCLHHPALRNTQVWVKLRQGQAVNQVIEETSQDAYDLVVIAAEGYGHLVSRIVTGVEEKGTRRQCSFFILKPPTNGEIGQPVK